MDIQQSLIEKIRLADRQGCNALLDVWATEHGYERLITGPGPGADSDR